MRHLDRSAAVVAACGVLAPCLLAAPAFPTAAGAQAEPTKSSRLQIEFSRDFQRALGRRGIEMSAIGPASLAGRFATFPAAAGGLDLSGFGGTQATSGGLVLRRGKRRLILREFAIKATIEKPKISVGLESGGRRFFARIGRTSSRREGFGVTVRLLSLSLTRPVEQVLAPRLGIHRPFIEGRRFGRGISRSQPGQVRLDGGTISLAGDTGLFAKLRSVGVTPAPDEAATMTGTEPPAFAFPLFGGSLAVDGSSGIVGTNSGLRLARGAPSAQTMWIVNLTVSPDSREVTAHVRIDPPPPDGGLYGIAPVAELDPSGSSTAASPGTRRIVVSGLGATINPFLATKLNEAFGAPEGKPSLFGAGEKLGVFAIDALAE